MELKQQTLKLCEIYDIVFPFFTTFPEPIKCRAFSLRKMNKGLKSIKSVIIRKLHLILGFFVDLRVWQGT